MRVIERTVRRALDVLNPTERMIIEGYYFDGWSFARLGAALRVQKRRVRIIHQRALARLETELTPFVEAMYGIRPVVASGCPICRAGWRITAERLLEEKTAEMTWGDVMVRLERAVGWRAPSPQTLITHIRKHRSFTRVVQTQDKGED